MSWIQKIPYEKTSIEYVPVQTKCIEYEDRLCREPIKNSEFTPYKTKYTSSLELQKSKSPLSKSSIAQKMIKKNDQYLSSVKQGFSTYSGFHDPYRPGFALSKLDPFPKLQQNLYQDNLSYRTSAKNDYTYPYFNKNRYL